MKRTLLLLALCLCLAVCAAAEAPYGAYTLIALEANGLMLNTGKKMQGSLDLRPENGQMTLNGQEMTITRLSREGDTLSIELEGNGAFQAAVVGELIKLDVYGDGSTLMCFAPDGADLSAYPLLSEEEFSARHAAANLPDSRVHALYAGLDSAQGVHLRYDVRLQYMDSEQSYDVQGRGGLYYSHRVTRVSGYEDTLAVVFRDGKAYNLYPKDGTGKLATSTSSSAINSDALLMDKLYSALRTCAKRPDYTLETREVDGQSYSVELFPAPSAYQSDAAFYFDASGRLAFYLESQPEGSTLSIGDSFYIVESIDTEVDDALFDISGYKIEE